MKRKIAGLFILILIWQIAVGQFYELQIGVSFDGTSNNSSNITVRQDLTGEILKLECSSNDCMTDAKLEWLDGQIPIRQSLANLVLERNGTKVTLHIQNFTADNYGQYRCRCVKEYCNPSILSETEHATFNDPQTESRRRITREPFCNDQEYIVHLLPENLSYTDVIWEKYVTKNDNTVQNLSCNSHHWRIWTAYSVPESVYQMTYSVTVTTSMDQAKLICLDPNKKSVEKIYYISIKDYSQFPLGFNRPFKSGDKIALDEENINWPLLCMTQPYLPSDVRLTLIINDTEYTANSKLMMTQISYHSFSETSLYWVYLVTFTLFSATTRNLFQYSRFSCRASSYWEPNVTVNFTIIHPSEVVAPTASSAYPSTCPMAPITSVVHLSFSSVKLSSIAEISSLISITSFSTLFPSSTPLQILASPEPTGSSRGKIMFFMVALVILTVSIIIVGLVFILCRRKSSRLATRRIHTNLDDLLNEKFLEYTTDPQLVKTQGLDHVTSLNSHRDMMALQKTPWYFPYERLEMREDLGSGAFGMVKKAIAYNIQPDEPSTIVAVKMLKETRSDEDEKDLISELKVLQHVGTHGNIVNLLGATVHQRNLLIIVEYCSKGNLLQYVRSKRGNVMDPITCRHLMAMAGQVAAGMEHLKAKQCIHRDLAARNILVTEDMVLKVADFGLARKIYNSIYRPSGGRIPVKWMAPETILDGEYTSQSDVWSFGVLMWEIMTLGKTPYPGKSTEEVIQCLSKGYRMPQPSSCPYHVYSLLLKCWDRVPSMRPNFTDLCGITGRLRREFEALEARNCVLALSNSEESQPAVLYGSRWMKENPTATTKLSAGKNLIGKGNTSNSYESSEFLTVMDSNHHYGILGRANSLLYVNATSSFSTIKHSSSVSYLKILCSSKDYLPMLSAAVGPINSNPPPPDDGGHDSSSTQAFTSSGHVASLQDIRSQQHKQLCSKHEQKLSHCISLDSICSHCRTRYSISSTSQVSSVVTAEEEEDGGICRSLPRHLTTRQNTYQNMNGFCIPEKLAKKVSKKSNDSGVVTTH